jgi:outer membrane receptor protein involved in Fe transport
MNRLLVAALATSTCIIAMATPAQAQSTSFEIPAGNLATALDVYARQSGRQVLYRADDVRSARSPGVRGAMTPDAALEAILAGTGFAIHSDSSGAVAIVRAGTPAPRVHASATPSEPQIGAGAQVDEPAAAAPAAVETEITVTGSRISRRDFQSDSPISTINSSVIASSGQPSLDRAIGQLPQFAAAQGAAEVGDVQGGIGFSGGQSYSDLRGLGPNRSLVLLDGRRLMPSSPDGAIDLNTIPTAMIDTVEVITGGASATYGSDAIAGVVNFKLKQRFSGIELNAQHGATTHGDGETNQVSAILGANFADNRGNAVIAFEYSDRALVAGADRPFFRDIRQLARPPEGIIGAGNYGGGAPTIAAVNAVLAGYPGTTPIAGTGNYPGAIGVNTDGTIYTDLAGSNCVQNYRGLVPGAARGLNISPNCRQVQVALGQYFGVQVPLKKYNAFARANYQLADHINAYAQFNFMESKAIDQTGPGSSKPSLPLLVPQNSPFVTGNPGLQAILSSITPRPTGNIIVTKLMTAFGNRVETFKYNVWQGVAGLKGDIPGTRINYDIYGSIGHSQFISTYAGDISRAAITSILNGTANFTGNAGTCKGYAWNPFGNNAVSPGCLEYTLRNDRNINTMTQKVVEGTLEGPIFRLPGGDLRFAVGADYRVWDFVFNPDSTFVTNDSLSYGSITPASGRQKVSEVFGELLVPILKDLPFVKELSLDLGYRYSHYNQFGNNSTWKIDGSWAPSDFLRFRGGYSRAIRAPSLANLYGPTSVGQLNIGTLPNAGDPCAVGSVFRTGANAAMVQSLCIAQGVPASLFPTYTYGVASVAGIDGSNPNLVPEKANTYSFGAVLSPRLPSALFRSLHLSVDYYNIKITGAIGSLLLTDILPRCFNSDGASNPNYSVSNPYCQRITRDPATGTILLGQQGLFNFATYKVDGVDAQMDWRFGLDALGMAPSAGSLEFDSVVSYLRHYTVAGLLGSPTLNYAGSVGFGGVGGDISHPKWKANSSVTYTQDIFSLTGRWRYISSMVHSDLVASPTSTTPGVPAYSYFDVIAHFKVNQRFTLGIGMTNITDKGPPFVSAAPLTTDAASYDVVGRTWFASLKAKF